MVDKPQLRWWSSPRTLLRTILMLDDTPHSIALGTAIGMFIGMTPTVGIQMLLVVLAAFLTSRLFQFNRMAALITVYISNPLTLVPIYWFDYKVGTLFVEETVTREMFAKILEYDGFSGWLETVTDLFLQVGAPLFLGSLAVATILSLLTYPALYWLLTLLRREKPPRSTRKKQPAATVAE